MSSLGILDSAISRFHRDLYNVIITPRFSSAADGAMSGLEVGQDELRITGRAESLSAASVVDDIRQIIDFLKLKLPPAIVDPLLERMLPSLVVQLISSWLDPLVPVGLDELANFHDTLTKISDLAGHIASFNVPLPSDADLAAWVDNLPATWLSRRREGALAQLRSSCYRAVKTKKTVERVETQVVAHDDVMMGGGQQEEKQEDEWNEDWSEDEEEQGAAPESEPQPSEDEDEDASAWGLEEPEDEQAEEQKPENSDAAEGGDEEDGWGWGDGDEPAEEPAETKPPSPKRVKPVSKTNGTTPKRVQPQPQEITLRETYTVTAIPDTILDLITQVLHDAESLSSTDFPIPEISAAAPALSSLPTLLLSYYRATATTFYATDAAANMLIYNDTQQLTSSLQAFLRTVAPSHPLSSRLRLDTDIKHLSSFAKRAYGREMDSQRTILKDLLSSASGFVNASAPMNAREYKNAVEDTVQRIRDVNSAWQDVLSESARLQSIGSLLSTVTNKLVSDILELADDASGISEEQSQVLKGFCDQVASVSDLFVQRDAQVGEHKTLVHVYTPDWLRFVYLGEILDASLADIKFLWTEGELSLEFRESEVIEMIEALFAESEYRRNAIRDIRRSERGL
jgi:protein transport protein DSL1/ZW10